MGYVYAFLGIVFLSLGIMAIPFPGTVDEQIYMAIGFSALGCIFLYGFFKDLGKVFNEPT